MGSGNRLPRRLGRSALDPKRPLIRSDSDADQRIGSHGKSCAADDMDDYLVMSWKWHDGRSFCLLFILHDEGVQLVGKRRRDASDAGS